MCGISGLEFAVIIVVAIVVLGPEKLPELMKQGGKIVRELRRMQGELGSVTREIQQSIPTEELRQKLAQEIQGGERARARDTSAESEVDAVRARLAAKTANTPGLSASAPAASPASSDAAEAVAAASSALGAASYAPAAGSAELASSASAPNISAPASSLVSAPPASAAAALPEVRRAANTVGRDEPLEDLTAENMKAPGDGNGVGA